MKVNEFINGLIAKGCNSFTYAQAKEALKISDVAVHAVLRRLKQKSILAQPVSKFYVIVPPEYKILGCRPAEHFIHDLMEYLNTPYYVGLLSAAQFYGAAHHRPQQFQVIIKEKRRPITCGRVKIVFITRKDCSSIPTIRQSTPHGYINVSSPEATIMDLISYPNRSGGMDNVLSVLTDLKDKLKAAKLYDLALHTEEITWIQRLGYLLDSIKADELSKKLLKAIKNRTAHIRPLVINIKKSSIGNVLAVNLGNHNRSRKLERSTGNQEGYSPPLFTSNRKKAHLSQEGNSKLANRKNIPTNAIINEKWKLAINKKLEPDT